MKVPDLFVGKRLFVGCGEPTALGVGPSEARGSAFIEGPAIIGDPQQFSRVEATLMVGPNINVESTPPIIAGGFCYGSPSNPFSLAIDGPSAFFGKVETNDDVIVGRHLATQGDIISNCGGHILSAKKNFDIPHPTKEGWRLRHTCPEGPSNDVYTRGKIKGEEIELPEYWLGLVDPETITVSLTPIGQHQDVIVKKIEGNRVFLQSKENAPINCYYHIFAERMDGEKLIPEYQGESPADYPGNNDEYSVSGYHYDVKK